MRRRHGWSADEGRKIACVVTGEMSDGTKVWTECDEDKNPVNIDKQYYLQLRGNWSVFFGF